MKRVLLVTSLLALISVGYGFSQGRGAQMAPATGPVADLANAAVDAINKGDAAWFESHLAPDIVWYDEDGHGIAGKERVLGFVKRNLLTGGKKLTITNLRVGNTADAAWSGLQYTLTAEGKPERKGTQTTFYKKVGNDWQVQIIHGAINFPGGHM